ncbi:hypothetical protein ACS0TY_024886 [Phlomoides rotata]
MESGTIINMQFPSLDSLFDAYQEHARVRGFSVVKRTSTNASEEDYKYVLMMVTDPNHELDPNFSPLMAAHRHVNVNMKRQLEANDIAGIRVCKNVRLIEVQSGGPQNLWYLPKDCRNFIEERRRLRLGEGDAEAI